MLHVRVHVLAHLNEHVPVHNKTHSWGKHPLASGAFHCFRNLSNEHGLVYDKTSRNCTYSLSSTSARVR